MELICREIREFPSSIGIQRTYSASYTLEHNSSVERSHRTIFESAMAMFLAAGIPISAFPFAVLHIVLVYNVTHMQTPVGFLSPFETRLGKTPNLDAL